MSPSNEYLGLISFRNKWLDLLAVQGTLKSLLTTQFKSINSSALSLPYGPTLTSIYEFGRNTTWSIALFIVKVVWEKEGLRMQLKSAPVTGIEIKLFHSSDINWVPVTFYWRRKWQPTPVFLPRESY